ncbi:major facilitator superfamily MFS_1 [Beutenbergia cavernae DSM 12333]|uniref:Major facilitator superfamily MFS_1 n=1 Tax=Beutenbergia cavernae (strain ATCC BAA-8 / DSM 12333 / CCUG 43141 / JCM 11478 / NBRC 16432 / NCIMB 13614 / HKI 0122) TaxID=471853 RepID=C5BY56_BEUC1|nr:MFS transporter [Beutenbergia cavernae]ACQ80956.1 major facilitator superfamily MFS_1 [Beutenbergia cavernae DSM 12333]
MPTSDSARTAPAFSRATALLVAGTFFMEILDGTILAPAAPAIAADLGVRAVDINVAMTAYLLTLAVLIPASGWVADRFGPRRVFMVAVAIFTVASVGCALAESLPMLVAARVLQGVGGSLMVPVGRLVVLRTTPKHDLVRAIAFLTWPALVAPVIAPFVGGVLSTYASWQWIFLINVPLGALALVLSRRILPDVAGERGLHLDLTGFALVAVATLALVTGMEQVGSGTAVGWHVAVLLAVAAIVAFLAVRHLLRARRPLLDLRILRIESFRATAAGGSVYRLVITAIPFLLALFFQLGFGWTAAAAGAVVVALFVGNVAIKPTTTPLMRRFGIRSVLLASIAGSIGCLVAIAFLGPTTPTWIVLAVLCASGVARSIGFTAYNSLAFSDVDADDLRDANTLNATVQELGSGLGIAVGALLVRLGDVAAQAGWFGGVLGGPAAPFRIAFLALAVVMLLPAAEAVALRRTAGSGVTGAR